MGIFHHHNQQGNSTEGAANAIVSQPAETTAPNPQQQPFGQQMAQPGQNQPYIYESAAAPPTAQPVETMTPEQKHHHFGQFGQKLGNAVVFGAGATLGADAVNGAINAFRN